MTIEKSISYQIEKQFPAIFREDGTELVDLVKNYYKFLEEDSKQSVYNNRRIFEYRDVDTTLESMILFFKNKYMKDMPLDDPNIRFIVKNILDLYRRKGSNEGIELFFRMFYDSEVEVYYPAMDMFKPSESIWKTGSYIQLYPVVSTEIFNGIINRKIFSSITNATAFVDNIYFININQSIIPLIFLSGVRGQFGGFETIYSLNPNIEYGRIYGSMRETNIPSSGKLRGDNLVGDIVNITSLNGYGGKGRIIKVSENLSGQIEYTIPDGGYGYTVTDLAAETVGNTDIIVSNQSLFIENTANVFKLEERIRQVNSDNVEVIGSVVGQTRISVGVSLDMTLPQSSLSNYFFERSVQGIQEVQAIQSAQGIQGVQGIQGIQSFVGIIDTIDREVNLSKEVLFASDFKDPDPLNFDSSRAKIGTIANTEDIIIITDIIGEFVNVNLSSLNYSAIPPADEQMSGTRVNGIIPNINTQLNQAFVPEKFTIGELATLTDINPGTEYLNDIFVIAKENLLSRFNYTNQILKIQPTQGVIISEGDFITQTKTIEDFYGVVSDTIVKGEVVKVVGNNIFVKQKTFEPFIITRSIFKVGSTIPVTVISRSRDRSTRPLGLNAFIDGTASFTQGKIDELEIIDSGFGYENGRPIQIFNTSKIDRKQLELDTELAKKTPDAAKVALLKATIIELTSTPEAIGLAVVRSQGITEGQWISFDSHINQEKVIQDSDFYQDYSYQLIVDVEPNKYEDIYRSIMHPAGIKLFTTFGQTSFINIDIDFVASEIASFAQSDFSIISEDASEFIVSEGSDSLYLVTRIFEV